MTRQLRDTKEFVKQNFGIGALLGSIAVVLSLVTALYVIFRPAMDQAHVNGMVEQAMKDHDTNRTFDQQNRTVEHQQVMEALNGLRADQQQMRGDVAQVTSASNRTSAELTSLTGRFETQFSELRTEQKSLWLGYTKLEAKLGVIDAKIETARSEQRLQKQ